MNKKTGKILVILMLIPILVLTAVGCNKSEEKKDDYAANQYDNAAYMENDKYGSCYQVFLYSFSDSNGDGIGDINGLTSRLDYIQNLGFDSIWLLPFNQAESYHKYDVTDYYQVDPVYGTMEDFENLTAECDKRGLKIYMDFVINHTSSKHPWFVTACDYVSSLKDGEEIDISKCPEAGYYNFKECDSCPTGWAKVSGTKDWYYECVFWSEMPDLNLDNEAVKTEIENVASFWMEKGVKGFRMDAALHYFDNDRQKSIDMLGWFCDYVRSVNPDVYVTAEVWDSYLIRQLFAESGVDSLFDFSLGTSDSLLVKSVNRMGNNKAGKELAASLININDAFKQINPDYVDAVFVGNHDCGRAAGFVSKDLDKTKLLAGLQLMTPGKVYVYYGDELGMSGSGKDENKRAPMYWTTEDSDEMTRGPVAMEEQTHVFGSFEEQEKDSASLYNYYRKGLFLRNKYPMIARGTIVAMDDVMESNGNIFAVAREYQGETVYVLVNINRESAVVTVDKSKYAFEGIADSLCTGEERPELKDDQLTIPAYGCVILK